MSTIDGGQVQHFDSRADEWWQGNDFRKIQRESTFRIDLVEDALNQHRGMKLAGRRVIDVGCGGGYLAEALAKGGAHVTGIDPGPANIRVALEHAKTHGLSIDYRNLTADVLTERFDVVCSMEVIEHVSNPGAFARDCARLCSDDGLLIISTINRTLLSALTTILFGEYILRLVPRRTHPWKKLVTPDEIKNAILA